MQFKTEKEPSKLQYINRERHDWNTHWVEAKHWPVGAFAVLVTEIIYHKNSSKCFPCIEKDKKKERFHCGIYT